MEFLVLALWLLGVSSVVIPFCRTCLRLERLSGGSSRLIYWLAAHFGLSFVTLTVSFAISVNVSENRALFLFGAWNFVTYLIVPPITGFLVLWKVLRLRRVVWRSFDGEGAMMSPKGHLALWLAGTLAFSAFLFLATAILRNPYQGPSFELTLLLLIFAAGLRVYQCIEWFKDDSRLREMAGRRNLAGVDLSEKPVVS